ncbi:MAG TPA: methyltransferase domain-containing protein [Solirubrobacteraceae bacterium]|nr:methyltransferase domain-containing protein [Solirubrobacteraceae bacterium]
MTGGMEFDEAVARQLEAMYERRDVVRRRALVRAALAAQPGERIVDVGCGPGFYVSELLDAVGDAGAVTGVDPAPAMLELAAARCQGRPNAELHEAGATDLPLPDAAFDAAVSVQVLEYVPDVEAALREIFRVLRPGGRVVAWDVDWGSVSIRTADPERQERILRAWDAHVAHPALPRRLAGDMRAAGFEDVRAEGHAFVAVERDPEAYGSMAIDMIAGFAAGQGEADAPAWREEQDALAERGELYFAVVQACFTGSRPGY